MNPILEQARDAFAAIRAEAAGSEQARQLTGEAVRILREAGVFGMTMSRRLGGPELDPLAQLDIVEAISRADGSAGWCTMIGSDGGYATSNLELEVAREMYPVCGIPTALWVRPRGKPRRLPAATTFAAVGRLRVVARTPSGSS